MEKNTTGYGAEEAQEGPISKAELKQAFARGQLGLGTLFWAAGMTEAEPLASIRELRWLVSQRLGRSFLMLGASVL